MENKWVNVNEMLPEMNNDEGYGIKSSDNVLVFVERDKDWWIEMAYCNVNEEDYGAGIRWYSTCGNEIGGTSGRVTYWMLLPDGPRGEK